MTDPIKPTSKSDLMDTFSISSRMAIRVGALWQKGVGISEGVLEIAVPDTPCESLLLSDRLLETGRDLDHEKLQKLIDSIDISNPGEPLSVATDGDRPVICLEEELLAEQAWTEDKPEKKSDSADSEDGGSILPTTNETGQEEQPLLEKDESAPLFDDKDVSELKLKILTGVKPEEKREAIRKLSYAPVEDRKKGMILLKALSDESRKVREEAARGLEQLGLSRELSDAIQTFLSGDHEQKQYAGEKIKNMAADLKDFEKATAIALLVSDLKSEKETEDHQLIINTLQPFAEFIGQNAHEHLPRLTRSLLQTLVSDFEQIHRPIRSLYKALGETVPEKVSDILWEEVKKVERRVLKAYLLILLGEMPVAEERKKKMTEEMVSTIAGWKDTEIECRRLGNSLMQQGEKAVEAIMNGFDAATEQQATFLLRLLDEILLDLSPGKELRKKLESFLVRVTENETRKIREALLDLRLFYHPGLTDDTRKKIAGLLLESVHRYRNERIGDMTPIALEKMGPAIIETLMEYLTDPTYDIQRSISLDVLATIFHDVDAGNLDESRRGQVQTRLEEFTRHIENELDEKSDHQREMIVAQARALAGPLPDREQVLSKLETLQERVKERDEAYPSLEGLGWLASSEKVSEERAMEIGISFLGYLTSDLPENISSEKEDEQGRKLLVEQGTQAYTELIPTIIEGLQRICRRENLKDSFREKIIENMLEKWNDLVDFNLVWGPATVTKLARHLGQIARCPYIDTSLKETILDDLARKIDNLTIVEIVGDILGEGIESPGIRRSCERISKALLEMVDMPDYQDPEDRRILLENLGKICSRRNVAGSRKSNKHLRKKIIDAIVEGMHDNIDGIKTTLEKLASTDQVPKKYRNTIENKLKRYKS